MQPAQLHEDVCAPVPLVPEWMGAPAKSFPNVRLQMYAWPALYAKPIRLPLAATSFHPTVQACAKRNLSPSKVGRHCQTA
eukprot:Skav216564  [mRNA]  locus=scaffold1231:27982:30203:- [translate_table: standard]